jgi:hypothetical protein
VSAAPDVPPKDRCTCVLRDHIPDDELPPICGRFKDHKGDYGWVCVECGHEKECHASALDAARKETS